MHIKISFFFLFLILLLALGCASDSKKPSADSLTAADAYDHIEAIKKAYESKDGLFIRKEAPELAEQIINEFNFEQAELTFDLLLVKITYSSIAVNLDWLGWWSAENGKRTENSGVAKFVLDKETMVLTAIEGDNPFLIPKRGR